MKDFQGFSPETTELLIGIRFNNNKEWFHQHRQQYKEYVHEPITKMAEEIYEIMITFDKDFCDVPKVCRANRDTRFSKNKLPYKESKWFFLRKDNISIIQYDRPNYFFEITPEGYSYGLGFWPKPEIMRKYRSRIEANPLELKGFADLIEKQDVFTLEGDMYKKRFNDSPGGILHNWYIRKSITLIDKCQIDDALYTRQLIYKVSDGFKTLHSIYRYFLSITNYS